MNFKNKKIALFGNAKSVFDKKRKIDEEFDIICRINAGIPIGKEEHIGSRTDMLFLSLALCKWEIEEFKTQQVIWCSPKREMMTDYIDKISLKFMDEEWDKLYEKLGQNRPSTGIMALEWLLDTRFKSLTLIGFDFWKTPNWYTDTRHLGEHNPEAEQLYIEEKIREYKGKIKWIKTN